MQPRNAYENYTVERGVSAHERMLNLQLFPGSPSLLAQIGFAVLATLCSVLLLVAWYQPRNTDEWIRKL